MTRPTYRTGARSLSEALAGAGLKATGGGGIFVPGGTGAEGLLASQAAHRSSTTHL
jgi:hypothetical protein